VGRDAHADEEVAARPVVQAGTALGGNAQAHAVGDAGGDIDLELAGDERAVGLLALQADHALGALRDFGEGDGHLGFDVAAGPGTPDLLSAAEAARAAAEDGL